MLLKAPSKRNDSSDEDDIIIAGDNAAAPQNPPVKKEMGSCFGDLLVVQDKNGKQRSKKREREYMTDKKSDSSLEILDQQKMCSKNSQSSFRSDDSLKEEQKVPQVKKKASGYKHSKSANVEEGPKLKMQLDQMSDGSKVSKGSQRSKGSARSSRHMQLLKKNLKNKKSICEEGNGLLSPPLHQRSQQQPIQFLISMGNINPLGAADESEDGDSIENEFPDPQSAFINSLKQYQKSFGKQEVFSFVSRKGQPVSSMRMTSDPNWAYPEVVSDEANQREQQARAEMQQDKVRHQQMVMDLLQDIEYKADFIPMQKDKFNEDIKQQEKQAEEKKYQEIEKKKMQEIVKNMSMVRISQMEKEESKKLVQISNQSQVQAQDQNKIASPIKNQFLDLPPPQVGNNGNNQVSDSDASFWDSDCPEEHSKEEKKRTIVQPIVSKHISQRIQHNKDGFLKVQQSIIQENVEDSDEENDKLGIVVKPECLSMPEPPDIQSLIKKVSQHIPGIKPIETTDTQQQLMELAIQLFERNKQLEGEKNNIIQDIKKKVQKQGHLVLQKFNSFGQSEQMQSKSSIDLDKDELNASKDNIQQQILDLTKQLESMKAKLSPIRENHLIQFKSQKLSLQKIEEERKITKFQSYVPSAKIQDTQKEEQLKSLQETLEQTKLNNELMTYIQDKLNSLMIDFNQGFILSLSIKEKQDLKEMIDQIDAKKNEQDSNAQKVVAQSPSSNNRINQLRKPQRSLSSDLSKRDLVLKNLDLVAKSQSPCVQGRSKYQIQSDNLQNEYFKKAFENQLYQQKSNDSKEASENSSEQHYNQLKEAQKTDYSFYFQMKNGIFIAQSQNFFSSFVKFRKKNNMISMITNQPNFETLKAHLKQEKKFRSKYTLVIDIENVFLARIDLNDEDDVQKLTDCPDIEKNYVIVKKDGIQDPKKCSGGECNQMKIVGFCSCNLKVYNIRPHTLELIGAIWPFFEMVSISRMSFKEVQQIVDRLEKILNEPIIEKNKRTIKKVEEMKKQRQKNENQNQKGDRIGRFKPKLLKKQLYFQFMVCHKNYTYIEELNEHFENLHILTKNRDKAKILMLTSNQMRLIACMDQGFCGIPVLKYQKFDQNDFQLRILETYLIQIQYHKDTKSKNINDFGILTQKPSNSKQIYKREQIQTFDEEASDDSFNPRSGSLSNGSVSNSVGNSAFKKREQLSLYQNELGPNSLSRSSSQKSQPKISLMVDGRPEQEQKYVSDDVDSSEIMSQINSQIQASQLTPKSNNSQLQAAQLTPKSKKVSVKKKTVKNLQPKKKVNKK